jgi:hypothetical protein
MFQVFALDERTAKFLQKVSGPLRNPIFFSGGGAHEGHTNLAPRPRQTPRHQPQLNQAKYDAGLDLISLYSSSNQ